MDRTGAERERSLCMDVQNRNNLQAGDEQCAPTAKPCGLLARVSKVFDSGFSRQPITVWSPHSFSPWLPITRSERDSKRRHKKKISSAEPSGADSSGGGREALRYHLLLESNVLWNQWRHFKRESRENGCRRS
ncbi:hypothetical protein RRG08_058960 [Elysia crispata]|uniref:Uncharacterized protein n=1 Tax=Elysia crispata TaxID=231223 RepID=A0AAE0XSW3_9GAST|nr:hypothetical protein RRG08_058960 [Elysia crispata]